MIGCLEHRRPAGNEKSKARKDLAFSLAATGAVDLDGLAGLVRVGDDHRSTVAFHHLGQNIVQGTHYTARLGMAGPSEFGHFMFVATGAIFRRNYYRNNLLLMLKSIGVALLRAMAFVTADIGPEVLACPPLLINGLVVHLVAGNTVQRFLGQGFRSKSRRCRQVNQ